MTATTKQAIAADIQRALVILCQPGQVVELRVPKVDGKKRTDSGYFNDLDKLARAAANYDGRASGVYFTLNPVKPPLLARAQNRVQDWAELTTADSNIAKRRWFPIDCDPKVDGDKRPAGISATEEEHEAAIAKANEIREWLAVAGWPEPIEADSGNGGALLYSIDLPNDDASKTLVEQCLKALAAQFDDSQVDIDTSVHNAARIWKVYGTMAGKGDSTADRPHRRAALTRVPHTIKPVALALLQTLAKRLQPEQQTTANTTQRGSFEIEKWLERFNIEVSGVKQDGGSTIYQLAECPFNTDHHGSATVIQRQSGALAFRCLHDSCRNYNWQAFREKFEPGIYERRNGIEQRAAPTQQNPQSKERGTDEFCTDLGNARRLITHHGDNVRFVQEWGWLIWNGRCWEIDQTGEIERHAKATVLSIYHEAANAAEHRKEALAKHAIASQAAARLAAMIRLAESEADVRLVATDFDTHDWLLTCANGVLNLRTGQLSEPTRDHLLTRAIPTAYNPDAECPLFLTFLDRIFSGNATLIAYIQRLMGYCLTGSTGAQCMFVLYGSGANGKSVLLNTIRALLGDYARNAAPETFIQQQQDRIRSDLARLAGCRVVSTVELDEGRRLSEALVKQMTGGDVITARFLNKNEFEFTPRFKVLMATNHKPIIRGTDYAIWRRIRLIPFAVTIPEAERDPQLSDRLVAELPGILAWALAGCLAWQAGGLQEPEEVQTATDEYRSEMDLIGLFLEDTCATGLQMRVPCSALYVAYSRWCDDSGERPVTQRRFGAQMTERGIDRARGTGGAWNYLGIGLVAKRSDVSDVSYPNSRVSPRENFNDEIPGTLGNLGNLDHYEENDLQQVSADGLIERLRARE
jgi:P4 family phage/plasmid primase-like protien